MKQVGMDTSIVLRLLVGLPQDQAKKARDFLEETHANRDTPVVCDLVVAEAYHALCYHYEVPRLEAAQQLLALLKSGWVETDGVALEALSNFDGRKPGLVDHLIREHYLRGARDLVTFDAELARLEHVRLL